MMKPWKESVVLNPQIEIEISPDRVRISHRVIPNDEILEVIRTLESVPSMIAERKEAIRLLELKGREYTSLEDAVRNRMQEVYSLRGVVEEYEARIKTLEEALEAKGGLS